LTKPDAGEPNEPDVYYPFSQRTDTDLELAIRMRDGTLPDVTVIQREVAALDAGLPLYQVTQFCADLCLLKLETGDTTRHDVLIATPLLW